MNGTKVPSEYLTIGEMAEFNHVTRKKLMIYEKKGLLVPEIVNPQTGYRYYSIQQCAALDIILRLQQFGIGLSQIKELVDDKNLPGFMEALCRCRRNLEEQIRGLQISINDIDELLVTCDNRRNPPLIETPTLEWLDRRRILKYPVEPYVVGKPIREDVAPLYNWENALRSVKSRIIEERLPISLFHNVGGIISRESLVEMQPVCTGAYVFNPQHLGSREEYREEGWYLTDTVSTMFDEQGNHEELRLLMNLLRIAKEGKYEINGDYYSEILAESPILFYEGRDMMLRLRLPVQVTDPEASPYYRPVGGTGHCRIHD